MQLFVNSISSIRYIGYAYHERDKKKRHGSRFEERSQTNEEPAHSEVPIYRSLRALSRADWRFNISATSN